MSTISAVSHIALKRQITNFPETLENQCTIKQCHQTNAKSLSKQHRFTFPLNKNTVPIIVITTTLYDKIHVQYKVKVKLSL
jgi:hypothetical protein